MFNSLTGTVTGKFVDKIYLELKGIEWSILMPKSSIDQIPVVGQTAKIYTWLYHRDDSMSLFGFVTEKDRSIFIDLMKVDGIGPKAGIKILSNISSVQLIDALDSENIAVLEKVPGLGKKTAAKMMLALKGKLSIPDNRTVCTNTVKHPFFAVIDSLSSMGYDKKDCCRVVSELMTELVSSNDFSNKSQTEKEDILFRKALMELAQ